MVFFDAVLPRRSTSGKKSEKRDGGGEREGWREREGGSVINNCTSLSDAGNSV